MNRQHIHIDLIEKYLSNELTDIEVELFNETLENDEDFVRELNDIELLIAGIKKSAAKTTVEEKVRRFESSVKIMDKDERPDSKKTIIRYIMKQPWMIAASLTFLLVTSVVLFNINSTPTHQKLYTEFYKPFENNSNKRSVDIEDRNYWKLALAYYDYERYDSALINFERTQISDFKGTINSPSFYLYKANTLMKLDRHTDARIIFQEMINDNDGMIIQAKWYLSMCYLHENNTKKLLPLLEEIAKVKASYYSRDAQKILDQLK